MSKTHFIIPIFVPHEGCPHDCVFCNQNSITGSTHIVNKDFVKNTIDEYLKTIAQEGNTIEVSFFGGTFTAIPIDKQRELLSVAKKYKENGKIKFIRLSTRPDYINQSILEHLKDYKVDIIELGVQSMDEEVLLKSGRGHTPDDVIKASELIKSEGFILGHQVMLGLPGDNIFKDFSTVERLIKLKPEIMRIYPALVIKNTPMEHMYKRKIYEPYSLYEAVEASKVVYGRLISENIKVIRIGLQPTEEINEGKELVAGPFHPAFRELVEGSIFNDCIRENVPLEEEYQMNIRINPRDLSKLYCNRKKDFIDMKKHINASKVDVIQDKEIERDNLRLETRKGCINLSIYNYITTKYKEGYSSTL